MISSGLTFCPLINVFFTFSLKNAGPLCLVFPLFYIAPMNMTERLGEHNYLEMSFGRVKS